MLCELSIKPCGRITSAAAERGSAGSSASLPLSSMLLPSLLAVSLPLPFSLLLLMLGTSGSVNVTAMCDVVVSSGGTGRMPAGLRQDQKWSGDAEVRLDSGFEHTSGLVFIQRPVGSQDMLCCYLTSDLRRA